MKKENGAEGGAAAVLVLMADLVGATAAPPKSYLQHNIQHGCGNATRHRHNAIERRYVPVRLRRRVSARKSATRQTRAHERENKKKLSRQNNASVFFYATACTHNTTQANQ